MRHGSLLADHFQKTVRYSKLSPSGYMQMFSESVLELLYLGFYCVILRCLHFKDTIVLSVLPQKRKVAVKLAFV